jgi:hypothetical protein
VLCLLQQQPKWHIQTTAKHLQVLEWLGDLKLPQVTIKITTCVQLDLVIKYHTETILQLLQGHQQAPVRDQLLSSLGWEIIWKEIYRFHLIQIKFKDPNGSDLFSSGQSRLQHLRFETQESPSQLSLTAMAHPNLLQELEPLI